MRIPFLALVLCAALAGLSPSLHADEITLKSGEVLKNVKILKKDGDRWRVRMPDGQRRLIDAADIASHVEKPTAGDELEEKAKAIDRKDFAAMVELGRWGMENGAELEARKLLAKVVAKDADNLEARALLGHEKGEDGKWRYGRELERYREAARAAELEAKGYQKIDGAWVTPYVARRLKADLVEKDGDWYTQEQIDRMAAGKIWVEGDWYEPEDQPRLDAGERKIGNEWVTIAKLNEKHSEPNDPWTIESRHWVLRGNVKHATLSRVAIALENIWQPLVDLVGDAPLAVDRATKPEVFVVSSRELYTTVANASAPKPRQNAYTDITGAQLVPGRGGLGYWYSEAHSLGWLQHAAAQAFLDEIYASLGIRSFGFEAFGAYFEGFHGGRYQPAGVVMQYLTSWPEPDPFAPFTTFKLDHTGRTSMDLEGQLARIGFAFHYVVSRHPEVMKSWMPKFVRGEVDHDDLIAAVKAAAGEADVQADFRAFLEEFKAAWKEPKLP